MKYWISFLFVGYVGWLSAQDCKMVWDAFIIVQTEEFTNPETSPLTIKEQEIFESLDYYPYDANYCVTASFTRTPNEKEFTMPTSTDRLPVYVKYGILHFDIHGEKKELSLYQSPDLMGSAEYGDYLFLPFGDETNGLETYGAGRYIDFRISDIKEGSVQLDFNKCYNPSCAYNHNYSCPRPPAENMLDIEIPVGIKGAVFRKDE